MFVSKPSWLVFRPRLRATMTSACCAAMASGGVRLAGWTPSFMLELRRCCSASARPCVLSIFFASSVRTTLARRPDVYKRKQQSSRRRAKKPGPTEIGSFIVVIVSHQCQIRQLRGARTAQSDPTRQLSAFGASKLRLRVGRTPLGQTAVWTPYNADAHGTACRLD